MIRETSMRVLSAVLLALSISVPARAQSAENVAVIINEASPASLRIGEYYVRTRGVPAPNVIRIKTVVEEEVSRAVFTTTIEGAIARALSRNALQDRVLYLVLTKGVPLRIAGPGGLEGTVASVDSELTLLYRKMTGVATPVLGRVDNPYYLGTRDVQEAQRFTHRLHDIFLVSRLDGFTVEEALALVDRAQSPSSDGRIVLDQRATLRDAIGDQWLEQAATRLRALGFGERVVLDTGRTAARGVTSVLGYYGWGSNDESNRVRRVGMAFSPGALAATFVSTDARTFKPPPEAWVPSSDWNTRSALFAGSPQTLIGDLIREGATGVAGHVAEPYLQSTVRPEILFPAYVSGFNLVEAFYLAIPHLSWQTVVIGDPLCVPFPRKVLMSSDIEDPADPETELPAIFSKKRLASAQREFAAAPSAALSRTLRAEARLGREDAAGARQALEEATDIFPALVVAQLQLATMYEQAGEFSRAAERYRVVLKAQPNNVMALNNLAYALAVRQKSPVEAKPLAQRAFTLSSGDPTIADTLAWVEHLLGNHAEAARLIASAVQGVPGNAEVRLHAAFIYAAIKNMPAADRELKAALKIDPDLATRDDVRELQARISGGGARLELGQDRPRVG